MLVNIFYLLTVNILMSFTVTHVFSNDIIKIPLRSLKTKYDFNWYKSVRAKRTAGGIAESIVLQGRKPTFYGEVLVGSNKQKLKLLFDTGSSILWVPFEWCTTCNNHTKFLCRLSETCQITSDQVYIKYVTGYVEGNILRDDVMIGDIVLKDVEIMGANVITHPVLVNGEFDGVAGLPTAFGERPSIIKYMVDNKILKHNVFSYYIDWNRSAGVLTFGGFEDDRVEGPLYPIPTNPYSSKWEFEMDEVRYGSDIEVCSKQQYCAAIADTGTSLIVGPIEMTVKVYNYISTKTKIYHQSFIRCSSKVLLPNLTFIIDGREYTVTPDMYIIGIEGEVCMIGVLGIKTPHWILGNEFLRYFYTIHDCDRNTLTFATLRTVQPEIMSLHNSSFFSN